MRPKKKLRNFILIVRFNWNMENYKHLVILFISIHGQEGHFDSCIKKREKNKTKFSSVIRTNSPATHSSRFRMCYFSIEGGNTFWLRPKNRVKILFFDDDAAQSNNSLKPLLGELPTFCPVTLVLEARFWLYEPSVTFLFS